MRRSQRLAASTLSGALALALAVAALAIISGAVVHSSSLTYYLHNNPTPPSANTAAQPVLPMDATAPTATTLYNYDTDRDSFAGLLIAKGASGPAESDSTKYQTWRTASLASDLTIDGMVSLTFWSGMKDFAPGKRGSVTAYLRDYSGSSRTEICQGTLTQDSWQGASSSWVEKTLSFNCPSYEVVAGHRIELKLTVSNSSDDDMWFAYDTTAYPSRIIIDKN